MRLKTNIYNKEDSSIEPRKVLFVINNKDKDNSGFTVLDLIKQLITKYELSKKIFNWHLLYEDYELDKNSLVNECLFDLDVVSLKYIKNQVRKEDKEVESEEINRNKRSFNQSKNELSMDLKGSKVKSKVREDDVPEKKIKKETKKKNKSTNEESELISLGTDKVINQGKSNVVVPSKSNESSKKEVKNGTLTEAKNNTDPSKEKGLTKTQKRNLRRKTYLMNLAKQELETSFNDQNASILGEYSNSTEKLQSNVPDNEVKENITNLKNKNYKVTRKNVDDSFNNETNYNESGYLNDISLNSEAFYNSLKNNNISNANKVDQSYSEEVKKDYDQMEVFDPKINPPKENQRIAFKVIELSDNYVPEVSDFKEAIVVSYNENTEEITYKLTEKVSKQDIQLDEDGNPILGKFELANNVMVEMGDTLIEYVNENDTSGPVTVHYSSLLELKKVE